MFNVTLNKKTFVLNEKTRILDLIPKEKQKNPPRKNRFAIQKPL